MLDGIVNSVWNGVKSVMVWSCGLDLNCNRFQKFCIILIKLPADFGLAVKRLGMPDFGLNFWLDGLVNFGFWLNGLVNYGFCFAWWEL